MTKDEFKKIRQSMKLRGAELATRIGKSVSDVLAYETGTKSVPDDVAKYLSAFAPKES